MACIVSSLNRIDRVWIQAFPFSSSRRKIIYGLGPLPFATYGAAHGVTLFHFPTNQYLNLASGVFEEGISSNR